jgi:hypothetical protein
MAEADAVPDSIGRHFEVQSSLGSGGTSRVLHVIDRRSGQHLALKQALPASSGRRARRQALFRQEFHVLSRIAHPNVVRAYEYGFEDGRPFYTMELLRGRALSELAPLAWQRLCAVILDLCAPLSMLHARRFVHCDVTARNVLVTERNETKLIDFGALTATDRPVETIAGTPPHMPPELVRRQSIDGRVDMFAIGALAYSMLTGQHAYPARTIQELPDVWKTQPPSVRERGFAIPLALDELIMSLLHLDASARPLQLAELVHRLAAIIDAAYAVDTASLQAQLATPSLVGREHALKQYRSAQAAALSGQGTLLCFAGAKGIGASRMLETCALEAIQAGAAVVHVTPEQAPSAPFGLLAQVLIAAHAQDAGLAQQLPSPVRDALEQASDGGLLLAAALAGQQRAGLVRPVRDALAGHVEQSLWRALCASRPLVVLIDDLSRADAESMRHCLGLSDVAAQLPLLVIAAIEASASKLAGVEAATRTIVLERLSDEQVGQLLRSLFGDAAQLEALTAWVCRTAAGVPGTCVQLAHHALEQGYVRFVDGQFRVTEEVTSGRAALPDALDTTIARAVAELSPEAREALGALARVTPFGALSASEQTQLLCSAGWSEPEVLDILDELRDAQLIVLAFSGYELRHPRIDVPLTAADSRAWHTRLAALYERRGHDYRMLAALHYDCAGERALAYHKLLALHAQLRGPDDPNIKLAGSKLGIALHQRMLAYALECGAPRLEVLHCRRVLLRLGATSDASLGGVAPALLEQLRDDVGLSFWEACDHDLQQCIARAQLRFEQAPAGERLAPRDAIRQLAQCVATATSICDAAFDAAGARQLCEQLRPLCQLGPPLESSYRQVETIALMLSHGGLRIERWRSQLQTLQQRPESMPELIWMYRVGDLHYHLGRELAQLGDAAALHHAEVLGAQQHTESQAASVRLLYALAYGDHESAAKQRRLRAIAALASRYEDQRLASSYVAEIELLDACGDLLELQHTAAWFEHKAKELAGFRPFATHARACCLLLTGQVAEAEQLVGLAVHEVPPLEHAAWLPLRALRAELALLQGEPRLAVELASDVQRVAAEADIDARAHARPQRVLALAHAALGELSLAHAALEPWQPLLLTVQAGQLHETRARIALPRSWHQRMRK